MKKLQKNSIVAGVLGTFAALTGLAQQAEAQVDLGTAGDFAVLAGSAVTNTGMTVINGGHVGVSPGSAVTMFPPGVVLPPYTIHAMDAVAAQAQMDLTGAYNDAAGLMPTMSYGPIADIGGETLVPGVYFFPTSAAITGTLTLDAQNDPNALFVFQIGSTLITASNAEVVIINGFAKSGCNVFWQVGSSATLGTGTDFQGHILAQATITLDTDATIVNGSALARIGAVNLDSNDISIGCFTGVCCTVGTCEILTPTECTALLGDYRGDDTLCVDEDCTPPICDAGGPYSVPCNSGATLVQLDGSGSSDLEASVLTYLWTTTCPGILGFNDITIVNPILTIDASFLSFCPLSCEVSLTVGDGTFTTTCTAPVSIVDITGPTISCVAVDVDLDLGCVGLIPFTVTVADACCVNPSSIVVTAESSPIGSVVVGTVAITNSVQLPGGVGYTITGTVSVSDVADCPATVVITVDADDCCGTAGTASTCSAVVSEITAPTLGVCTTVGGAVDVGCEITIPFSAVFVDECCMDDSALTTTVVVEVDGGSAATIDAAIVSRVLSLGGTTLTVSGTVLVSDLVGCSSSIHILVNAVDCCGNAAPSCEQSVMVSDDTGPGITCPADITRECGELTDPTATGTASATDNCDTTITPTFVDVNNLLGCAGTGTILRTWTATDSCGATATCLQTITVVDVTLPAITCPADLSVQCGQSTAPAVTGSAVATDVCDTAVTVTFADVNSLVGCDGTGTISRTWTAVDDCGVISTCVQIITVIDDIGPIISCPAAITIECGASSDPSITLSATATDNCDLDIAITFTDVDNLLGCSGTGTIARTWLALDACGNFSTCIQTITVQDTVGLSITCPADLSVDCGQSTAPEVTGSATVTATDLCDVATVATFVDAIDLIGCGGTGIIARTWTAIDVCGNISSCVQVITVEDDADPVITCPVAIALECSELTDPLIAGMASATDDCDTAIAVTFTDVDNLLGCAGTGTITRTWLATDDCGNFSSCIQLITIQDSVGPTIICPADIMIPCEGGTGLATAFDSCGAAVTPTFVDEIGLGPCDGTGVIARTWTATDDCGNDSTCLQVITVLDNIDPVITCPTNITINCGQSTDPAVTLSASATDDCGIGITITFTDVNNLLGCAGTGTISRTWLATDDCGNSSSCIQLITVLDLGDPTITCPADLMVPCGQSIAPGVTGSPTTTDLCDLGVTVTFVDVNGASGCDGIGPITRTWTATDDCGNVNSCVQTINLFDTGVPLITCPANITRECGQSTAPPATGIPIASDTCDTAITPTFTDVNNLSGCDGTGTIVRTWRAQDDCGNFDTCSQTITVQDTVGPTITCPANLSVQCGQSIAPLATGSATATDLCDTSVIPTFADVSSLGGCSGTGTIARTWTAIDDCGNATSCVQTITVVDNVNPVITCPAGITLECGQSTIPSVTGLASATDNCDTAITPTFTDQSNLLGCDGTGAIARLWRAQDDCGNFSTCTQTITVRDIVGPTIICPANFSVPCGESIAPVATGSATATDSCDIAVVPTFVDVNSLGGCSGTGTIARTWTAMDDCGNASSCVQTITLFDDVVPVISCAASVTIECGQSTAPSITGTPGVTDNCDTSITPTFIDQNNLLGCNGTGTITRTWRAQDDCGNFSTCLQTITIQDSVGPTITCPANHSVQCGQSIVPLDTGLATATDVCDTSMMVTFADVNSLGGCNGTGIITRTWSVLDDCGNASSCVQTINVIDTTIPLMTCPPDIALTCETLDGMPVNAVLITNGLAVDNCDTVVPVTDDRPISGFYPVSCDALGTAITYTATDECGNVASCVMYVRVGGGLCCPGGTDTDLKLMVGNLDLRQDTDGPVTTKARFDVWNSNEVRFSGTERCITCWDETLISNYGPLANHLVLENLQTDKGKARIQNEGSTVCPNSSESPLLGVAIREYQFLGDPSVSMRSAVTLVGMGEQPARIQYDIIGEPEEAADSGLIMGPTVVPRGLSVSPLAPSINLGGNSSAGGVADNRASTTFKGSLIFWPVIEAKWDANGTLIQDTFIQLLNDNPGEVKVQLYQVNGDGPLDPVIDQNTMEIIERGHPGWNWSDYQITLTGDESAYWSVASGLPKGVSPISVLDPGNPNGRPDLDPSNPGGRVIRGFLVGWAVNDDGHEIRWNHLKGHVLGIRYDQGTAYDYNPWSFRVVSGVPEGSESDGDPGNLNLDGIEYDLAPSALLFDFFATGSQAFSHPSQRE